MLKRSFKYLHSDYYSRLTQILRIIEGFVLTAESYSQLYDMLDYSLLSKRMRLVVLSIVREVYNDV